MFQNMNPMKMEMGDAVLSRRSALFGLGAVMGGSAIMGAAAVAPQAAFAANSLNLDFNKPDDNLTAWVKLVSSLEDGVASDLLWHLLTVSKS